MKHALMNTTKPPRMKGPGYQLEPIISGNGVRLIIAQDGVQAFKGYLLLDVFTMELVMEADLLADLAPKWRQHRGERFLSEPFEHMEAFEMLGSESHHRGVYFKRGYAGVCIILTGLECGYSPPGSQRTGALHITMPCGCLDWICHAWETKAPPTPLPESPPLEEPCYRPYFLLPRRILLRHITRTPGVCGGRACIRHTRIPVWSLEQARRLGSTLGEMLESFPTLTELDLWAALVFAQHHPKEIERDLTDQEEG